MAKILTINEAPRTTPPEGFALWRLGFRPFYLLASSFAALSVLLWAAQLLGLAPHAWLAGPVWHAHEMLFGFTLALIVGFLFTAGRNWSDQPTPTGPLLAGFAALWLAGRVLVLTPFSIAAAVVNVAFPLAAAIALAIPFWRARSKRNYFFVGLLMLMAGAQALVHLGQLGVVALPAWAGLQVGLDVVLFMLAVMGGRVIPMFTNNGIPGTQARRLPWLEKLALGGALALLAADALRLDGLAMAMLAGVTGATHLARLALWQPWRTLRTPLVWVLHLGYAWVPVHLALRALAALGLFAPNLAVHALTLGAIGVIGIGMMTRTARGHTGRPLKADASEVACYLLVAFAAVIRVLLPLLFPLDYLATVIASALLWSAGFGLYALRYWPVLSRPRLDGRPG
ncbi:NnrS family protein [Derxia gummosa]|uniref:NnrS family protein n=1 Tax=Derxia gummosa DSM 723 TaxID=1121388 RepID=A0A8B6X3J1_9BURK|nr:NnrS family protein [Derxia gummosa]